MLTDLKGQCNVVSFAVAHVIHDTISVPALQIDQCNGRGLVDQVCAEALASILHVFRNF